MMAQHKRPMFFNLFLIRLPVAGIMSIIHRVTGVVMTIAVPVLLYLLQTSLSGEAGFEQVQALLNTTSGMIALFLLLWSFMHHLFAGVRYLLIDVEIGVEKPYYRYSAWFVMLASPVVALLLTGVLL